MRLKQAAAPIMLKSVTKLDAMQNLEILERLSVQSIRFGCGNDKSIQVLQGMFNVLYVAHNIKRETDKIMGFLDKGLSKIRKDGDGRYFIYPEDAPVIMQLVNYNQRYWLTKTSSFYATCVGEVMSFYKSKKTA